MAIKRLYAPRDRVDELSEAVLARCEREVVGDGLADEVTLGPLHTAAGRDRVQALVKDAAAQGATVRTAGRIREADADAGGYFVLPTVVTDVASDSALASEEQFGPVLPIFGYDAIDDAVAAANATDFGLTASVWTGDDALADTVTGQLIAGTVSVNCHGMTPRTRVCRSAVSDSRASGASSVPTVSGRSPRLGVTSGRRRRVCGMGQSEWCRMRYQVRVAHHPKRGCNEEGVTRR